MEQRFKNLSTIFIIGILYYILVLSRVEYYLRNESNKLMENTNISRNRKIIILSRCSPSINLRKKLKQDLKYIYLQTNAYPFHFLKRSINTLIDTNCTFTNCYATMAATLLRSPKDFDAVLFHDGYLKDTSKPAFHMERSVKQKYIHIQMGKEDNSLKNRFFNNFFNCTYKFNTDFIWALNNFNLITTQPFAESKWLSNKPANQMLGNDSKQTLKSVAWFSNCSDEVQKSESVRSLQVELQKHGWLIDGYDWCGKSRCAGSMWFHKTLANHYQFYLSVDHLAEGCESEKLLVALQNFVIPIVFGDYDYTRVMPPGSYLDATKLDSVELAKRINVIMRNKTAYQEFFRWKNHIGDGMGQVMTAACSICTALNEETIVKTDDAKVGRMLQNSSRAKRDSRDITPNTSSKKNTSMDQVAVNNTYWANSHILKALKNVTNNIFKLVSHFA